MSLINKKSFILDEEYNEDVEHYTLPALVKTKPEVISIKKTLLISTALHPLSVLLIWLV